jgi:peptide chain release factor 1
MEEIKKEYEDILNQLSDPELVSDWEKFEELSKKKKELEKIIDKQKEIEDTEKKIKESQIIIASEEEELKALAEAEITQLKEKEKQLKKDLQDLLKEDKPSHSAIIEIRAGAGGDEAALFAADLYKMYSRYAESQGWQVKILDSHAIGIGGFKEIIFELKGNSYNKIKHEGGVHRVQRIPETEKAGRVHTSTASVAVLPKPKTTEIKIRPDQLKIDVFRSPGPGGQNVNKRETAVRITHLPSGLVVESHTERNQLQNKENAMAILSARLLEKKEEEAAQKIGGKRKEQIGKAMRAEKIRTYNFPQDRITDHRIKKSWHGIEEIMSGKLDKIISILLNSLDV